MKKEELLASFKQYIQDFEKNMDFFLDTFACEEFYARHNTNTIPGMLIERHVFLYVLMMFTLSSMFARSGYEECDEAQFKERVDFFKNHDLFVSGKKGFEESFGLFFKNRQNECKEFFKEWFHAIDLFLRIHVNDCSAVNRSYDSTKT